MARPLIIDYDSTIVNSQKAICELYNKMFNEIKDFIPADWTKVRQWNLLDQCPLLSKYGMNAISLFETQGFFELVEFYDGAIEALEELSNHTDITICTAGTARNISHKVLHLDEHLPFANIAPVIIKGSNGYGKEIINMENAIFIDDHASNLETSNAMVKICFGDKYEWNKDFKGLWLKEWDDNTVQLLKSLTTI